MKFVECLNPLTSVKIGNAFAVLLGRWPKERDLFPPVLENVEVWRLGRDGKDGEVLRSLGERSLLSRDGAE